MDGNQVAKKNKHTNIQYFSTTDRLKVGDVSRVIYKPTGNMESDYLTKALQGKTFQTHHKTLMGLDGINDHMLYEKYKRYKNQSVRYCKYYITHT